MAKRRKQTEKAGVLTKGGAIGALVMVLVAVFVCIVAITLLYAVGNRRASANDPKPQSNGGELNLIENQLKEIFPQELEFVPTPDLSDAQAFAKYNTKSTYYRECTVIRTDGRSSVEQTLQILREGDFYNIKTIQDGILIETLISDGKQACIINEVTGGISFCPLGDEFTTEDLAGITDHRDIVSLVTDYTAGGDARAATGLSSLSLSMFRNKGSNMLVVNLSRGDTGTREIYYYYLDYGYIYHAEISLNGVSTYSVNTTVFTVDISDRKTPESFVFPQQ